jgi:hypothetical protein
MAMQSNDRSGQDKPRKKSIFDEVESHVSGIIEGNVSIHALFEAGVKSLADGAKMSVDMVTEFTRALTGLKSVKIVPKPPLTLEVDIQCKESSEILLNRQLFPFVELQALVLGKHMNFETLMNATKKGLQLNINEGMDLRFNLGPLGVQTVPLQGNVLLAYGESGELALITTHVVPGTKETFTTTIPIKSIIEAQFKNKK